MKKLPIAASLVLAFFAFTCANSVQASGVSFSAPSTSAPQTSSSPAPGGSATKTPAKSSSKKHSTGKKHRSARREPTQKAPTPDRISEIQTALARGGYYQGSPNGKWDSNTVAAMQKFQSDNSLTASGKINAASLQKLGLGSATAGVGAPKPAQPPASSAASPAGTSSGLAPVSNNSTASTASPAQNSSSASKTPRQ